jgi:hypothetical protein
MIVMWDEAKFDRYDMILIQLQPPAPPSPDPPTVSMDQLKTRGGQIIFLFDRSHPDRESRR